MKQTGCRFLTKNKTQVYKSVLISRTYGEYVVLSYFLKAITDRSSDNSLVPVLERLGLLYGLWNLDKHLVYLYEEGFANGVRLSEMVKEAIIRLCEEVKPDAVAVVDALAPPDHALNSVLAKSDGRVSLNFHPKLSFIRICQFLAL